MTTQQITAANHTSAEKTATEEFFELVTLDGETYRQGQPAPYGTVTTEAGANVDVVVESWEEDGDWISVELSKGYTISIPEARIARLVTRGI